MFVQSITDSDARYPNPADDFWYQAVAQSASGVTVTAETAIRASAVFACVNLIAETIASLPRGMYKQEGGKKSPAPEHPLESLVAYSPDPNYTAFEWFHMQTAFLLLFGDYYAEIIRSGVRAVEALRPIHPALVTPRSSNGVISYEVRNPLTNESRVIPASRMHHVRDFSLNGVKGLSRVNLALDPIGLALVIEAFASRYFSADARPAGALIHPGTLKDEARKNLKKSWRDAFSGIGNSHGVALLEEGLKFETFQLPNDQSQFLESRKMQILEIARYWKIPPHMIGELDRATFSNIEQQSIDFVRYTITPHITRIEQRFRLDLIGDPERYYLKHNMDALLRGETKTRYEAHASAINAGWLTRNEVRSKEDMNPIDGLDEPLTPLNMQDGTQDVVQDAAARVVGSEMSNVDKIVRKHDGKPSDMIAALEDYYSNALYAYAVRAFAPLTRLLSTASREFDATSLARSYTSEAFKNISQWSSTDPDAIKQEKIKSLVKLATIQEEAHAD